MRELLLLRIDGRRYGVWKDQVVSVRGIETLHRLPLSPACIAGISIIDDRTVTLADLPVCIGYAPRERDETDHVLMLPGSEKLTGLMVSGDVESLTLCDDAEFPMPDYLKTGVIDACVVRNDTPIPVINVSSLSSSLLKSDHELPRAEFIVPRAERGESTPVSAVRVFEIGGESYAAASEGMEEEPITPGPLARLALVPLFVRGITFHNGAILPVIDLSQRIKRQKSGAGARALVADISGQKFALLADKDRGTADARDLVIAELPAIARTRSIAAVALNAGELMPLVDLAALLSRNAEDLGEKPLDRRYTPASGFGSVFGKQDVDVVEFSVLGTRHALPKSEVEDIVPFTSFRRIPDAPEIVIGVAEHTGAILPVLDLAMVFGRRSLAGPDWSMVLVKNGDFRSLVITEAVFGERRLRSDIQRPVPIQLPHHVVYGCYPDAQTVRLILNVEALAVHFEKSLVRDLLPALSEEMMHAPAELVPSLLGQDAESAFEPPGQESSESQSTTVDAGPETPEPAAIAAKADEPGATDTEEIAKTHREERQPEQEAVVHEAMEQEPIAAFAEAGEERESASPGEEKVASPVLEAVTAPVLQEAEIETGETEKSAVSASEGEVSFVGAAEPVEPVAPLPEDMAAEDTMPAGTTAEAPDVAAAQDARPFKAGRERMGEEAAPAVQERTEEPRVEKTAVEAVEKPAVETTPAGQALREFPHEQNTEREMDAEPERPERAARRVPSERFPGSRRLIGIGAVAAVLTALVLVLLFVKPESKKSVKEIPGKTTTAVVEHEPAPVARNKKPSLALNVPANRAVNIDVYVVIKGDTLWSISERFTGNPFNYPRIAGENGIADPDFILPGRKIRLVKIKD
jgi:chemotaxis signal transduction protein/nucleoid-associated protein YgaU